MLGGGPKIPSNPPAAPKPPTVADPSVQAALQQQMSASAAAKGRSSTILTGGQGDTSKPMVAKKTLLGQ